MAVLGTFSSFTTARLGIYASQASLNVTGNNIANINTTGYTRQRMDLVSLYSKGAGKYANIFNRNVGYGVLAETRTQLRDPFLDIRYRNENTNLAANTEKYNGLYQLSHTLDEVNKGTDKDEGYGVIQANLKNFVTALEKLHANVGSQEFDRQVRGEAESLTVFFNEAAKALQSVYDGKAEEFTQTLKETNVLLNDIRDLNEQIRTAALYGDTALELRDQRNLDLDKLSELMHINVEYSMERVDQFTEVEKLTVTIADSKGPDGKPIKLIDGVYGAQISVQDREPLINPDYDPVKINAEKEKTREEAAANNPLSNWKPGIDAQMGPIRQRIEADNAADKEPWATQIKDAKQAAIDALLAQKPDATADEQKAAADAAAKTVDDERLAKIEADVSAEEKALWKIAAKQQQEIIDNAVKATEEQQIKTGGKYYKAGPDGKPLDPPEFTNDLYVLDGNGNPSKNPDGSYQYNAATFENDKFLLQVDPLKDRRDRLMIDPNTVSKESEVVELGDTVLYGKIQAQREMLTEEGEYASNADLNRDAGTGTTADPPRLSGDPDASKKRGIPYYQKALDSLARQFAEEFNQANQLPATTVYQQMQVVVDADGKLVEGADPANPVTGEQTVTAFIDGSDPDNPAPLLDADGKVITEDDVTKEIEQEKRDEDGNVVKDQNGDPVMEKVRVPYTLQDVVNGTMTEEDYGQASELLHVLAQKGVKDPLYGFYDGGVLFSNNGNTNDPSGITASNITVSHGWATETVHVLNDKRPDSYREDGTVIEHSSRNDNIRHMITLFDKQLEYSAKDVQGDSAATDPIFKGSFREVYTTIEGILATDQNITEGKMNNYQVMTLSLENNRQSVSGVDLNDEATNMMQFSKSYAAACRLLTTIDSMLDKLINGTAI